MVEDGRFTEETKTILPTLYRICMSMLGSEADAQDAVQQALMKAWEKRASVRPDRFRAWLTRISINECRNIQRHRMRVEPADMGKEISPYIPPDVELAEAVQSLPDNLRIPLLLKYMEAWTEKEIAAALRLPQTTVKNRLYRARRALEKTLTEEVTFNAEKYHFVQ